MTRDTEYYESKIEALEKEIKRLHTEMAHMDSNPPYKEMKLEIKVEAYKEILKELIAESNNRR